MSFLKIFSRNKQGGPVVANLGTTNQMYYNKELKRWVDPGQEDEIRKEMENRNAPPPKLASSPAVLSYNDTDTKSVADLLCQPPSFHSVKNRTRSIQPMSRTKLPSLLPPIPIQHPEESHLSNLAQDSIEPTKIQCPNQPELMSGISPGDYVSLDEGTNTAIRSGYDVGEYAGSRYISTDGIRSRDDLPQGECMRSLDQQTLCDAPNQYLSEQYNIDNLMGISEERRAAIERTSQIKPEIYQSAPKETMDSQQQQQQSYELIPTDYDVTDENVSYPGFHHDVTNEYESYIESYINRIDQPEQIYEEGPIESYRDSSDVYSKVEYQEDHHKIQDELIGEHYEVDKYDYEHPTVLQCNQNNDGYARYNLLEDYHSSNKISGSPKSLMVNDYVKRIPNHPPFPNSESHEAGCQKEIPFCHPYYKQQQYVNQHTIQRSFRPLTNQQHAQKQDYHRTDLTIEEGETLFPSVQPETVQGSGIESIGVSAVTLEQQLYENPSSISPTDAAAPRMLNVPMRQTSIDSLLISSSLEEISDRNRSKASRRSTVASQSSMDRMDSMNRLKEELEARVKMKEAVTKLCQRVQDLAERNEKDSHLNDLIETISKNNDSLGQVEKFDSEKAFIVQQDKLKALALKIQEREVLELPQFGPPVTEVTAALLFEFTSRITTLDELLNRKLEEYEQRREEDSNCLTQIRNQMSLFEATIEGHRAALHDALVDKANMRVRCEAAERLVGELTSTCRRINESWEETVKCDFTKMRLDHKMKIEEVEQKYREKYEMYDRIEDENRKLKEFYKKHEEGRDATIIRLNASINDQWELIKSTEAQYNDEIAHHKEEIERYKKERMNDANRIVQLRGELERVKIENESLQTQLLDNSGELLSLRNRTEAIDSQTKKDIEQLRRSKQEMETLYNSRIQNLEQVISASRMEKNELQRKCQQMDAEKVDIKKQQKESKKMLNQLEIEFNALAAEKDTLKCQLDTTIAHQNAEKSFLHKKTEELEIQLVQERSQNLEEKNSLQSIVDNYRADEYRWQNENSIMRNQYDVHIQSLQMEILSLKTQLESDKNEKHELRTQFHALEAEMNQLNNIRDALENEREVLLANSDFIENERNDLMVEKGKLEKLKEEIENSKKIENAELETLRTQLFAVQQNSEIEKSQLQSINKQFVNVQDENIELKRNLEGRNNEKELNHLLQLELSQVREEIKEIENKNALLRQQNDEHARRNADLTQQNEDLVKRKTELEEKVEMRAVDQALQEEMKLLRKTYNEENVICTREKDDLVKKMESLIRELDESRHELNEIRNNKQQSSENIRVFDDEMLEKMKNELRKVNDELEVMKQKEHDTGFMLRHLCFKWQELINEYPKVAQKIDARIQLVVPEESPME